MPVKPALDFFHSQHTWLTFDDVLLLPDFSEVVPDNAEVTSKFSRNIGLKIPIVSAAMDTVTESSMAIEMAILGGLGIIHKNLSIEKQAEEVARVKHHLSGVIERPIRVYADQTVAEILEMRRNRDFSFHSFPVTDRSDNFMGIITGTNFDFCDDDSRLVSEIMTSNPVTAPKDTDLKTAYEIMMRHKKKTLPLVDNGRVCGMYVFRDVKRIKEGHSNNYCLDEKQRLRVGAAIGVGEEAMTRLEALMAEDLDVVVIDTAHGDTLNVINMVNTVRDIKRQGYKIDVVAGNVAAGEGAKRLADAGADGIKVGIGPGSICTTRVISGVGGPQVSATYTCVRALEEAGHDIPLCADGGITYSGAITLAIGAGAHSVMMGSLIAGTIPSPGKIVFLDGRQWKTYRGMGSVGAMQENSGSRERYGQSGKSDIVPEGIEGLVPFSGPLESMITQYIGGLRRGMGYVGAKNIETLRQKATFIHVTNAGQKESHPHDIKITRDAPNYHGVMV